MQHPGTNPAINLAEDNCKKQRGADGTKPNAVTIPTQRHNSPQHSQKPKPNQVCSAVSPLCPRCVPLCPWVPGSSELNPRVQGTKADPVAKHLSPSAAAFYHHACSKWYA